MAASQRQIRDGGILVPTPAPAAKAPVQPVVPGMIAHPVPSPARALQEELGRHAAADFALPHVTGSRRELGQFIVSAIALWGGALGLIAVLMVLAR
jgi:hypothetical protein